MNNHIKASYVAEVTETPDKAYFEEAFHRWTLVDQNGKTETVNVSDEYRWTHDVVSNDIYVFRREEAVNIVGFVTFLTTSGYYYARYTPSKRHEQEFIFNTLQEAIVWLNDRLNHGSHL